MHYYFSSLPEKSLWRLCVKEDPGLTTTTGGSQGSSNLYLSRIDKRCCGNRGVLYLFFNTFIFKKYMEDKISSIF